MADFNLDGHLDVFVSLRNSNSNYGASVYGYVWDVFNNTTSSPFAINTSWSGKSIPLIADIDNDGMMEVIIQGDANGNYKYLAFRYNPQSASFTNLWGMQPDEDSYSNSITAFDFNQDGLLELLICDQSMVRIVNGSGKSHITHNDTASVYVMTSFPFSETTIMQYPVIADVDNDGHAEIVFVGNNRLNILESSAAPWAPARKVWNQYMYNITCVNEDLTVPQSLFNNAYAFTDPQGVVRRPYNNFLQQATTIDRYGRPFYAVPDLVMDSASVNYGDDSVTITFHYCNQGDNTVNAPYTCSVSAPGLTEPIYTDTIEASLPMDSCGQGLLRLANSLLCGVADLDSVTVTLRTGGQPECDSTNNSVIVALHPTFRDTVAVSICDNQPYTIWDTAYNTSGYHIHTVHHATGCDSIHTLDLTVRATTTGDTAANVCDSFIWYNQTFTQSGNQAIHTFTNSANCDSTVTLHLTVRYSTASTYYDTVIENLLPRSFNGHSFTNDTANVLVTIPNAVGCDSNITYHLHVHHNVFVTVDSNLCNDILPITWNGVVFDTLVSQTDTMTRSVTFTAVTGADSTVRMNLHVHPLYDHHQYEEICDKQTFAFGDSVYASTGDYTDTLRSIHGCDSLSTLHLVVHNIYEQHYVDTICHDMTYEWRGHTVHSTADNLTEDFILHDSLYSIYGCDSVDILTLTKMALPEIAFTADTDCSISGYRLSVSATAPLSTGEEPRRMPYLHWTASPRDHSLSGQESADTVGVSPRITTKYILYADYHKTPLCPATDSITLDQIIVPKAIIKVNPTTLSRDNLHFVAQDKTQSYHTHCYWYLDGMMYPGSGPIFEGDADPEADSVVIGLEVENGQCRDTAEMTLHINKVIVYVPNIFTPSKEDNNIFRIVTRGVTEGDLYIYDRVGNLVFHTNDLSQGWGGTHNGQPCQQRAYVWKLRFRTVDQPDGDQVKTGTVTLIR